MQLLTFTLNDLFDSFGRDENLRTVRNLIDMTVL
jgi:hypothetical protein